MLLAWPKRFQRSQMHWRRISLVGGKTVPGIARFELGHMLIAPDFGDDRSRGDAQAELVALDDRTDCAPEVFRREFTVDQHVLNRNPEPLNGARHGQMRGVMDIDAVDFCDTCHPDSRGQGPLADFWSKLGTLLRTEKLAVRDFGDPRIFSRKERGRKDDGPGDYRSREAAPADLVDSDDDAAGVPKLRFPLNRGNWSLFFQSETPFSPRTGLATLCGVSFFSSLRSSRCSLGLDFALNARSFTFEATEVVELGATDAALLNHFELGDFRRRFEENTLDAHAVGVLANREGAAAAAVGLRDHDAFEGLNTLFLAFFDADVDANGVARAVFRKVRAESGFLDRSNFSSEAAQRHLNAFRGFFRMNSFFSHFILHSQFCSDQP